ncbi:hypothetical protein J6590_039379 [Homalodisca vitripennis]|nr:hypothetical protein J6590_039379 [Homalodisca vitripennis]
MMWKFIPEMHSVFWCEIQTMRCAQNRYVYSGGVVHSGHNTCLPHNLCIQLTPALSSYPGRRQLRVTGPWVYTKRIFNDANYLSCKSLSRSLTKTFHRRVCASDWC